MTGMVPLVEQALEDTTAALVLADLLEERGEQRRAALVRRLVEAELDERRRGEMQAEMGAEHFAWLGPHVGPIMQGLMVPLEGLGVLPLVVADVAEVEEGPLVAGAVWRGTLHQRGFQVPTTMRLRREGNRVWGVLEEDFGRMYPGAGLRGTFHFAGAAVGRALAFRVSRVDGHGIEGGFYALRLRGGGWLSGTWWVPSTVSLRGELRLRRVKEEG